MSGACLPAEGSWSTPGLFLSLWDLMYKIDAAGLMDSYRVLVSMNQAHCTAGKIAVHAETFEVVRKQLHAFHGQLVAAGMFVSAKAVGITSEALMQAEYIGGQRVLRDQRFATFQGHLGTIPNIVSHEMSTRFVLMVRPEFASFYSKGALLFGQEVLDGFSTAAADIEEAGKCMALERHNAAVFHLMKIMECGLRAVHACLGIGVPFVGNDRNWGNVLKRMETAIEGRGKKWQEYELFQEFYVFLRAVKDAWRNPALHVDRNYTPDEASAVLSVVQGFMVRLSSRMNEAGQPVA